MEFNVLNEILKHNSLRLRRSDVARNLRTPVSTIKYYTREGLIKVAGTTEGGMIGFTEFLWGWRYSCEASGEKKKS